MAEEPESVADAQLGHDTTPLIGAVPHCPGVNSASEQAPLGVESPIAHETPPRACKRENDYSGPTRPQRIAAGAQSVGLAAATWEEISPGAPPPDAWLPAAERFGRECADSGKIAATWAAVRTISVGDGGSEPIAPGNLLELLRQIADDPVGWLSAAGGTPNGAKKIEREKTKSTTGGEI